MEEPLPQGLLPSHLHRASQHLGGLGLQPDMRRLLQKIPQIFSRQLSQRVAAFATELIRQIQRRAGAKPKAQLAQRGINHRPQSKHRRSHRRFRLPNNVQDDAPKRRVGIMPVRVPTRRPHVHLHIPRHRQVTAKLNHGAAEIRSTFHTRKTGVKNLHRAAIQCRQVLPADTLIQPNRLQETLRRRIVVIAQ